MNKLKTSTSNATIGEFRDAILGKNFNIKLKNEIKKFVFYFIIIKMQN